MATYSYTFFSPNIPPIPLIAVQLTTPESSAVLVNCQGILDTGSDVTLVPLPLLVRVNAEVAARAIRIPFSGTVTLGIPYDVGLIFDRYIYEKIRVFGCPVDDLGEYLIIGRDLMNQHNIEFDGPNLTFTIF